LGIARTSVASTFVWCHGRLVCVVRSDQPARSISATSCNVSRQRLTCPRAGKNSHRSRPHSRSRDRCNCSNSPMRHLVRAINGTPRQKPLGHIPRRARSNISLPSHHPPTDLLPRQWGATPETSTLPCFARARWPHRAPNLSRLARLQPVFACRPKVFRFPTAVEARTRICLATHRSSTTPRARVVRRATRPRSPSWCRSLDLALLSPGSARARSRTPSVRYLTRSSRLESSCPDDAFFSY